MCTEISDGVYGYEYLGLDHSEFSDESQIAFFTCPAQYCTYEDEQYDTGELRISQKSGTSTTSSSCDYCLCMPNAELPNGEWQCINQLEDFSDNFNFTRALREECSSILPCLNEPSYFVEDSQCQCPSCYCDYDRLAENECYNSFQYGEQFCCVNADCDDDYSFNGYSATCSSFGSSCSGTYPCYEESSFTTSPNDASSHKFVFVYLCIIMCYLLICVF
jgi:hypothetical protein